MFRITSIAVFAVLTFTVSAPAFAQINRVPRYRPPAGATMPRALDYFRQDVGVLDPYNTFVAPRRTLDRNLQSLQNQERYDAQRTKAELSQIRQSTAAPTGTGSTFMNYSHYYSSGGSAGSRTGAARAPR
jgi:hypothetical protein